MRKGGTGRRTGRRTEMRTVKEVRWAKGRGVQTMHLETDQAGDAVAEKAFSAQV
jgi:hypothetical protein